MVTIGDGIAGMIDGNELVSVGTRCVSSPSLTRCVHRGAAVHHSHHSQLLRSFIPLSRIAFDEKKETDYAPKHKFPLGSTHGKVIECQEVPTALTLFRCRPGVGRARATLGAVPML